MEKKFKKIITNSSIICLIIAGIIGLLLLFKAFEFTSIIGKILLTLLTIFVSGIFLLTSLEVWIRNKKIGIVSISLIGLSMILFLIMIWAFKDEVNPIYLDVTVTICAFSLLLNIVSNFVLSLGKNVLPLQLVSYISFFFIEVILLILAYTSKMVFGDATITIMVAAFIVFIITYIILKIKCKNYKKEDTITISLSEYNALKERIAELESKIKETE